MKRFIKFPALLYPLFLSLSLAQARVLWVIVRQTIGWQKVRDGISLRQFQYGIGNEPGTGMSRTHIVAAIRWLEAQCIIRVVRQVNAEGISGTSIYSLAERFLDADAPTIDMDASQFEAMGSRKGGAVSDRHCGDGLEARPTIDQLSSKETSSSSLAPKQSPLDDDFSLAQTDTGSFLADIVGQKEQEAISDVPVAISGNPAEATEHSAPSPVTVGSVGLSVVPGELGAALVSVSQPMGGYDPLVLSGILALGFSQRKAEQLFQSYPIEQVRKALQNLPLRNARNPAGYLLRELQVGDYADPLIKQKPVRRPMGLPQPTVEQVESQHTAAVESDRLQKAISSLAPETRAAWWEEAKRHCARLGRRTLAEDSPLLQAQFEIIVQSHLHLVEPVKCCA